MKCASCGMENPADVRSCGGCAARLTVPGVRAGPLGARGGREVGDGSSACGGFDGERRLVTVVFADIAGFTALAETLDPEPLRDLVNALFGRLVPCVERYGGTVDKYLGDELMALFGAPVAHENDAERAVRAALDMRAAVWDLNRDGGTDLAVHIGINTGRVLAGSVGTETWRQYSVIGDAVNIAARLTQAAGPGEILIGQETHAASSGRFDVQEVGPLYVKGRAAPVVAFRVVSGRVSAERSSGRQGGPLSSPLVGREAERAAFMAALDRLEEGRGGVLVVSGEPGIGKSRLVAEVRRETADRGLTWLEGRSSTFGGPIGYGPIRDIIRVWAGIHDADEPFAAVEKLGCLADDYFPGRRDRVLPYLATLLGLPVSHGLWDEVGGIDGETMQRRLHSIVRGSVMRLAERSPVVMVFEDAHWMDESSPAMIERLMPVTVNRPVLLCIVGRPESGSPMASLAESARGRSGVSFVEIPMSRLSVPSVHQMVQNLVGSQVEAWGFDWTIEERTGGNPLFVEETIRVLIDLGALAHDQGGGWKVTPRAASVRIPDAIENLILARVDLLNASAKDVLKAASVIGRFFPRGLLEALIPDTTALDGDLATLENVGLIRRRGDGHEGEYAFGHALVHEAVYSSMLVRRRRQLHLAVAQATESLYPDGLERFYSLLAYHYTTAEAWGRAREFLLRAGDQAFGAAAGAEAITHFEQALETQAVLLRSSPEAAEAIDPLETAALWRKIAKLRMGQRRMVELVSAVAEAEAQLQTIEVRDARWWAEWIEVQLLQAMVLYWSRAGQALSVLLEKLEPVVEEWGTAEQRGHLLVRMGGAGLTRERFRPSASTIAYARAASRMTSPTVADERTYLLGVCLLWADRLDEARVVLEGYAALVEELDDVAGQALALAYLGCLERRTGDVERVSRLVERCLKITKEGEVPLYGGVALANGSWVHWKRRELVETEQAAREALVLLTGTAPYPLTWIARWPLIGVLLARGDTHEVIGHAVAMLEPSQQELPVELSKALAEAVDAWESSRPDEALEGLRAAHVLAQTLGYD